MEPPVSWRAPRGMAGAAARAGATGRRPKPKARVWKGQPRKPSSHVQDQLFVHDGEGAFLTREADGEGRTRRGPGGAN